MSETPQPPICQKCGTPMIVVKADFTNEPDQSVPYCPTCRTMIVCIYPSALKAFERAHFLARLDQARRIEKP